MTDKLGRTRAKRGGNRSVMTKLMNEADGLIHADEIDEQRLKIIADSLNEKLTLVKSLDEEIIESCHVEEIANEIEESEDINLRVLFMLQSIMEATSSKSNDKGIFTVKGTNGDETAPSTSLQSTTGPQTTNASENVDSGNTHLVQNVESSIGDVSQPLQSPAPSADAGVHAPHSPESSGTNFPLSTNSNVNTVTSPSNANPMATQPRAKLPKLVLPKFKGDVTQWQGFWDSYNSSIHTNPQLTQIDKFNHLHSLLEGQAARSIQGLTRTEANYNSAIDLLHKRFGKPQNIISKHMDEMLKIPGCVNDNASQLRHVYDRISINIRGLESLGVSSSQYGSLLIPVIMSKLPPEIRIQVARNTAREVWEMSDLLEVIRQEVEAREISDGVKTNVNLEKPKPNGNRPTSSTLLSHDGTRPPPRVNQVKCVYCGGLHYSASCESVSDPQSRIEILKRDRRCFVCLRRDHQSGSCSKNCRRCHGNHHQSICRQSISKQHDPSAPNRNSQETHNTTLVSHATENPQLVQTTTTASSGTKGAVLLQTARAVAYNEDGTKSTNVRILFDNGSQRSYVTNTLKSRLSLEPLRKETLHLNTFGEQRYRTQDCDVVNVRLGGPGCEEIEICALGFPVICSSLPNKIDVSKFPHLHGLELAEEFDESGDESIDILIGSDYYWNIVSGETVHGESGPTAVKSKLGWLLSGPNGERISSNHVSSHLVITGNVGSLYSANEHDELLNTIKDFWETESIGIKEQLSTRATEGTDFLRDPSYDGKRYEVGLPWKEDCVPSTNNYQMCSSRLKSLRSKLSQEPALLSEYNNIINEQEKNGIIERAEELCGNEEINKGIHFSPHHAVVRKERETTKVRIVYDGSAKSSKQGRSLNDCLETGPNFIPHIFDMLAKFRWNSVGLTADIEKAFLNVGIKKEDRDMLRFLWFKDPTAENPEMVQFRFNRLVFGLRPSPSILCSTIKHHLKFYRQSDPEMAEMLENSLYVDDLITGDDDDKAAFAIYKKSKTIMAAGGFRLRKWNSNSANLIEEIAKLEVSSQQTSDSSDATKEDDESYAKSSTSLGSPTTSDGKTVKVLGINWDTDNDEIFFNFAELYEFGRSLPVNKRSVLKLTAKIFDPLGFLSPFVIRLKMLFQVLCSEKIDWDQPLRGEMNKTWNLMFEELKPLGYVRIPRCYFYPGFSKTDVQLHGFSDASERAYGAVVYIRVVYSDSRIETRLVASKTRVSPIKKQSIPRLELLGAVILSRLTRTVLKALPNEVNRINYWVDSRTVLCWIKNDKHWKQYVKHRVDEIRQLTAKQDWRYCPGVQNPADLPSRGLTGNEMVDNSMWWCGPQFLQLPEEEWPQDQATVDTNEAALSEVVKNPPNVIHVLASCEEILTEVNLAEIIHCQQISSLGRLLRVTAYVLRFVDILKRRTSTRKSGKKEELTKEEDDRELNSTEISRAESLWIKTVQASSFKVELKFVRNECQPKPRRVEQFGLFLDENKLLRCRGRLNNAILSSDNKNPILLPSKHPYVELLIRQTHDKIKHSSVNNTLTTIRERFWILRGRQAVKRVLKRCVTCRRLEGLPYSTYNVPDLPSVRVSEDPPFTHTGVDFAGPLFVRGNTTTESDNNKCYVCLFTCASTRAVHLELTPNLTVDSFLLAFRRFTSRRGLPATLMSDNGKTFRGSSKEIVKIARSKEVLRYLAINGVSWRFIVEKAPWWGGFWERLIQSVKRCMKKSLGRTTLSYDELNTLLVEVESVINSRPLTYVEDDQDGVSYTLSPSHLINGRRVTNTPNDSHFEVISTNESLTRRARHHRHLLRQFTGQWRKTYLLSLRERHAQVTKNRKGADIAIGDVVILKNDTSNRMFWKLAKVEELVPGKDGNIRAAIIKVSNADRNPRLLKRSVKHLFPLEVNANDDLHRIEEPEAEPTSVSPVSDTPNISANTRPRRNAAIMAELKRRFQT